MLETLIGPILAMLGCALVVLVPGMGSSRAVGGCGEAASGVLAEDPDKFGRVLILQALPATQGIYGLLSWFLIMQRSGMLAGNFDISPMKGFLYFLAALPMVLVGYYSAIAQGKVSEAAIALVAKRPAEMSKGLTLSAMVETYAILALLATILAVFAI